MATQKRSIPSAAKARADINQTIDGIFNEDYQDKAYDPAIGGGSERQVLVAYITQSGADSPDISAVVNTIGESITVNRVNTGRYRLISSAFSNDNGIAWSFTATYDSVPGMSIQADVSGGTITIRTYDENNNAADGVLQHLVVIEVFT